MAQNTYIGIDNEAKELSNAFIGIDGKARQITAIYIGDENGKAQLCWSAGGLPGLYKNGERVATWKELTDAGLDLEVDITGTVNVSTTLKTVMSKNAAWSDADKLIMSNSIKTLGIGSCSGADSIKEIQFSNKLETIKYGSLPRSLISLILPDSLKSFYSGSSTTLGSSIKKVYFGPHIEQINAQWFRGEATYYIALSEFSVHPDNQFYKNIGNHLYSKDGTKLIRYAPSDPSTSFIIANTVTELSTSSCADLRYIQTLEIPNHVTSIGSYAFAECYPLTSVSIPASVTTIGSSAWADSNNIKEFIVDNNNNNYTSDNKKILYSKDHKTLYRYAPAATGDTYSIPSGVTSIRGCAFQSCDYLKELTFPSTVTRCEQEVCANSSLEKITLPSTITYMGPNCFAGSNLKNINSNNATTIDLSSLKSLKEISSSAFSGCAATTVILPRNGLLTTLVSACFRYCDSLTTIKIPKTVTKIGTSAFGRLEGGALTNVYYEGTQAQWQAIAIDGGNNNLINATNIYYNATW